MKYVKLQNVLDIIIIFANHVDAHQYFLHTHILAHTLISLYFCALKDSNPRHLRICEIRNVCAVSLTIG